MRRVPASFPVPGHGAGGAVVNADDRADLAERMVPEACHLAVLVHDADAEGVAAFIQGLDPEHVPALLVVLAALVPVDDRSPGDLLAWEGSVPEAVKWRQMPLMAEARPGRAEPEPCPSPAAYRRHKALGEPAEECGCHEAAKASWRATWKKHQAGAAEVAGDAAA